MWKNLSKKARLLIIVSGISVGLLIFLASLSSTNTPTEQITAPVGDSQPYVPGGSNALDGNQSSPVSEETTGDTDTDTSRGSVDVNTLDMQVMDLDYEALALMSTYYFIMAGDIGEDARSEIFSVASDEVRKAFTDNWEAKRALATDNPDLSVFVDAIKVSDAPAGENDVAIAILANVYRSYGNEPVEVVGKVRWTVFFDFYQDADSATNTANWTISRVIIRNID